MKTIILFASKYGAAQEIAQRIANKITEGACGNTCVLHNIKDPLPSATIKDFDCIIFGTSIYASSILKEAKVFLENNENLLLEKTLGLFLSGIGTDEKDTYFPTNFSENLLQKAKARGFLGGVFDPKKAKFAERIIIKIVTKQKAYINTISDRKIEKFVNDMKS